MISTWKVIGMRGLSVHELHFGAESAAEARKRATQFHRFWLVFRVIKVH